MSQRIEVFTIFEDGRAKTLEQNFVPKISGLKQIRVVDVYTIEENIAPDQINDCIKSFENPVTQRAFIIEDGKAPANDYKSTLGDFDYAIEIGFLAGVTDNIGHTAQELTALTLDKEHNICSSRMLLIKGDVGAADLDLIKAELHNPLIQRATIVKSGENFPITIPKVQLDNQGHRNR